MNDERGIVKLLATILDATMSGKPLQLLECDICYSVVASESMISHESWHELMEEKENG